MTRKKNKRNPRMTDLRDPVLAQAVSRLPGGYATLAKAINATRAGVWQWKRVPPERVLQVEKLTGVPRHELRPDLYPAD